MAELPPSLAKHIDPVERERAFEAIGSSYHDLHCIVPGIWLGNQRAAGIYFKFEDSDAARAKALEELQQRKISVVVCCCGHGPEWRIFSKVGISYADAHLLDGKPEDIAESASQVGPLLLEALPLVRAAMARGEGVLVHCNSGIHRSASVVCGLLMILNGWSLEESFRVTVRARAVAYPIFWPYLSSGDFAAIVAKSQAELQLS